MYIQYIQGLCHQFILLMKSQHEPRNSRRYLVAVQLLLSCLFMELLPINGSTCYNIMLGESQMRQ
jgi:hypothetical protein